MHAWLLKKERKLIRQSFKSAFSLQIHSASSIENPIHTHTPTCPCLLIRNLNIVESTNPSIHTHIFACSLQTLTSLWNPQIHPYTQLDLLTSRNLNVLLWSSQTHTYLHTYIFACSLDLRSPQNSSILSHLCLLIWHLTFSWSPQIHPYPHIFACSFRNVTSLWNPQIHPYTKFYLLTINLNFLLWSSQIHPYIYTYITYIHTSLLAH